MEELIGEAPPVGQLDLEDQKGGRNCEDAVTERLEPRGLAHVLDMYADHRSAIRSPSKRNTTMPYCTYPVSSAFQRRRRATRSSSPKTSSISIAQQPPDWPVSFEDWERAAEEKLDPGPFGYIAGGAGAESTMRANLDAFERWQLRPRMLAGNSVRDISVDVLGMHSPAPFFL